MTDPIESRHRGTIAVLGVLIVTGLCICVQTPAAQERPAAGVSPSTQPAGISSFAPSFVPAIAGKADIASPVPISPSVRWSAAAVNNVSSFPGAGPRRITLDEAQQQAATANNPMLRLAALGVEAAKQHRLGVESDFFPKLSSTFANLHFNKFMGELIEIHKPSGGGTVIAVPIFSENETMVAAMATQPITPLFKLRQVLTIARADEQIARSKAGMPVKEVAGNVEQSYFELLVTQRQREVANAKVKKVENQWRLASTSAPPAGLAEHDTEWLGASKALVLVDSNMKEAAATLNALLGWPLDTQLELVVPAAFYEDISLTEAAEQAMQNNPEVVEAEQTVIKARAAAKLSTLDYVPDVAVVGGYAYQTVMPALPNDFSYVGVMASYNLFDFGKRERTVKERNAQVSMAETGLMLVKAKVAASVTKAYYQLDGSRQFSELARRMNAANRAVEVKYEPEEAEAARAKSEAEMLQAELEHRLAYSRLQQLIGGGYSGSGR
jgi:outer membrane protein TolC